EPGQEVFGRAGRPVVCEWYENDFDTCGLGAIQGAMQSDEQSIAVSLRKLSSGVERQTQRCGVRRQHDVWNNGFCNHVRLLILNARVNVISPVRIRPSIESAVLSRSRVIRDKFIAETIAFINGGPHGVRAG